MAGRERVRAEVLRRLHKIGEFDELVAGDAGHGSLAAGVARGEFVNHLLAKLALVIENEVRNAESRRDISRIVNVAPGAAGALAVRGFAVIIKLHRDAHDVIALLLQQSGDDARVDAARHGDDDARLARRGRLRRMIRYAIRHLRKRRLSSTESGRDGWRRENQAPGRRASVRPLSPFRALPVQEAILSIFFDRESRHPGVILFAAAIAAMTPRRFRRGDGSKWRR